MGAKLYADTATKRLVITLAPDGNGEVRINAQVDVWSDLIEDWEVDLDLRKFTFPVVAIGGQTISAGQLGTTYVLLTPWQIAPYEADHELIIDGNLFTESALTRLILPTVGGYTVTGTRNLSTLVEVRTDETAAADLSVIRKVTLGKKVTDTADSKLKIWDPDDDTLYKEARIAETSDGVTDYQGAGLEYQDKLVDP